MFQLASEGFDSVFEILVACIISIRTHEEVTLPTARRLFAVARTPREVAKLSVKQIDDLIRACTFHEPKSRSIRDIAVEAVEKYDGKLPCDFDALTSLHGVGPKCANLVLGIACDQPHGIAVDIHVHRVTNRWGYVHAPTPERTMRELQARLAKKYWVEINKLLVPFGKFICTAKKPKCSTCPVLEYCRQAGVTTQR
jgi:endonuclease-3